VKTIICVAKFIVEFPITLTTLGALISENEVISENIYGHCERERMFILWSSV
jgi:hypothetical protein